jgi:hypothetical protein
MRSYGIWGHDSFISHGLYVMENHLEQANALVEGSVGTEEGSTGQKEEPR